MGWGLNLNNVQLSRVTKDSLQSDHDDAEADIRRIHDRLKMLAASTPRTVEEDDVKLDWLDYVERETNELLDELAEVTIKRYLASQALAFPEDVTEY